MSLPRGDAVDRSSCTAGTVNGVLQQKLGTPSRIPETAVEEFRWIKAGSYAINAGSVFWINTAAKWMGDPEDDAPRDAWGEVPPGQRVERSGVEVFMILGNDKALRFVDGSPEAEGLKRFVQAQGQNP